jgi:hypothetical protein
VNAKNHGEPGLVSTAATKWNENDSYLLTQVWQAKNALSMPEGARGYRLLSQVAQESAGNFATPCLIPHLRMVIITHQPAIA